MASLRANDRRWFDRTGPLRTFLGEEERSWDELLTWGKKNKTNEEMIRNMLAWLFMEGLAAYSKTTKKWRKRNAVPVVDMRSTEK